MTQQKLSELLGFDNETLMKAKSILPTFDLGKMEVGSKIILQILDLPKEVETKDKYKGGMKKTKVLPVLIQKIIRGDGLEIADNEKYGLWLSSKSLSLGIAKLSESDSAEEIIGKKILIRVGMAEYKGFGENRCYNVNEL